MPEPKDGSRERRTRTAEVVDAGTEAVSAVARWTPQQAQTVIVVLLLSFLCAAFGLQLWIAQERDKARDREAREAFQTLMREFNAREELRAIHCAAEAEKVRRESAETVKAVLAATAAEGERNRTFQREEFAKFRAEFLAAVRGKSP